MSALRYLPVAPRPTHECVGDAMCDVPHLWRPPLLQVPLVVLAPQPVPTAEAPFYSAPPAFWSAPTVMGVPTAINLGPSAPPLAPELLKPGGWVLCALWWWWRWGEKRGSDTGGKGCYDCDSCWLPCRQVESQPISLLLQMRHSSHMPPAERNMLLHRRRRRRRR